MTTYRPLKDLDALIKRREYLRSSIPSELAAKIESNPDLYYNFDKFRIARSKAVSRAAPLSLAPIAIHYFRQGGNNINRYLRNNRYLVAGQVLATFFIVKAIYLHSADENYDRSAHEYARVIKFLRNAKVQQ